MFIAGGRREAVSEGNIERDLQSAEALRIVRSDAESDGSDASMGRKEEEGERGGGSEGGKKKRGGWKDLPDMQMLRCNAVGCCVAGRLYVIGGTRSNQQVSQGLAWPTSVGYHSAVNACEVTVLRSRSRPCVIGTTCSSQQVSRVKKAKRQLPSQ